MRMCIDAAVAAALAAIWSAGALAQATLDPEQFVAGWSLDVPPDAQFVDVPLEAEVYAAASGVDELAVLDASGRPLSFFVRSTAPTTSETRVTLDASPLYAERSGGAAVDVQTGERGTAVTVTPGAGDARAVVGFVIDARSVTTAPIALELDWRSLPQPFLIDVEIEQSTNLDDWRRVGSAAVAALSLGGAEVRHPRVPVRASPGGYYRIRASRAMADWHVVRATLVGTAAAGEPPRSARVAPLAAGARPDDALGAAWYFDAGAVLPVTAVALEFGDEDGWVRADVATAASLDGPWSTVTSGELFYAIGFGGQRFASQPVALARSAARYWRVSPAAQSRPPPPVLRLDYPQEYLRVAVAGDGPYLLAAGTRLEAAGPDPALAAVFGRVDPAADVPRAALGPRRELGGAAAVAEPFPWRVAALWATLALGVLVVGFMAARLAREMAAKSS